MHGFAAHRRRETRESRREGSTRKVERENEREEEREAGRDGRKKTPLVERCSILISQSRLI